MVVSQICQHFFLVKFAVCEIRNYLAEYASRFEQRVKEEN